MGEAEVWIDGVKLTDAQSSTLRVAIMNFIFYLHDPETDLAPIGDAYKARSREIEAMLVAGANRGDRASARKRR